jgi:hypothetical protein
LQRRNFEERQAVMNSSWLSIVLIAGLLAAGNAFAQAPLPRQHAVGSVSYVTGGIGSEEAQAMRDASADYPLTLELAAASGGPRDEYISMPTYGSSTARARSCWTRGPRALSCWCDCRREPTP